MKLTLATKNSHKTQEIREMAPKSFEILDINDLGDFPQAIEDGTTFLANATIKAIELSKKVDGYVLSDDSGLVVDALGGAPGVYSSRYAGTDGDDQANNAKLLREMEGVKERSARFACVMVIARKGLFLTHFEGIIEGKIIDTLLGSEGFGYDPLFIPEGYEQSFGELAGEIKNQLSHRSRALSQTLEWLGQQ